MRATKPFIWEIKKKNCHFHFQFWLWYLFRFSAILVVLGTQLLLSFLHKFWHSGECEVCVTELLLDPDVMLCFNPSAHSVRSGQGIKKCWWFCWFRTSGLLFAPVEELALGRNSISDSPLPFLTSRVPLLPLSPETPAARLVSNASCCDLSLVVCPDLYLLVHPRVCFCFPVFFGPSCVQWSST